MHSLHAYFIRPGDPSIPIIYEVDRTRDGRSFTTRRVVAVQRGKAIFSLSGKKIPTDIDSVCVHGDEESAVAVARAVREGLEQAQIRVLPLPQVMAR